MKPGEFVVYEENESKISQVLTKKAYSDKIVKHYANPNVGDKCCIGILKLYLSKLPPFFYRKLEMPSDTTWFSSQPLGHNTLGSMIQTIFQKIAISGNQIIVFMVLERHNYLRQMFRKN